MRAVARQKRGLTHEVEIRGHTVVADEPRSLGGEDEGPTPQELVTGALAACTAITVRMYAGRKGWDLGEFEVDVESESGERGACGPFTVVLRLSKELSGDRVQRLRVIAGKCPVHRTLASPEACVIEDRVELV
ncbi:MAG: OsmC family protein [Solirubrobacterales bacterium]